MLNANDALTFKIVVDDSGLPAASARAAEAMGKVGAQASVGQKKYAELAKTTALTRQETLALNYTLSDVAASLASGASPWTILLQQGGQVKDQFGGLGPLFTKLSALITPVRIAAGLGAAALGTFAYALYEGDQQSQAFNKAMQQTGNFAGLTAGKFAELARDTAAASRTTVGSSREILQALVLTGQVGPGAIGAVGEAAARLSAVTGKSAQEVAKDFAGMSTGVAKWAAEHNKAYNFLNLEQYKYIQQLERQDRTEEAQRVAAEALSKALKERAPQLGTLQAAWKTLGEAASSAWDRMLNIGRESTLEDRLADVQARLEAARRAAADPPSIGPYGGPRPSGQSRVEQLAEEERLVKRSINGQRDRVAQQAAEAAKNQKEIEAESKGHQEALSAIERARLGQSQAIRDAAREREALADKRALDALELSGSNYMERRIARERAALNDKSSLIDQEIALEKRRDTKVDSPEALAQKAKLIELETKRVQLSVERAKLEDKIARGDLYTAGPAQAESANQQFLRFERAQQAETEKAAQARNAAAAERIGELIEFNRSASLALIQDDRARGEATIALEEEQIRKRLDLTTLSVNERQLAEQALAEWRVNREKQLTEELKPEYQRQLELFQDQQRYMRQAQEEFMQGFIDQGRDAFTEWVKTGKLSSQQLVGFIKQQFAQLVYDRYLSGSVASIGEALFKAVAGSAGGGTGYTTNTTGTNLPTAGGRAGGGGVRAGSLTRVNERGTELLTVRGNDYLMMGNTDGKVTPAGQFGGKSANITFAPVTHIDSRTDRAEVAALVLDSQRENNRQLIDQLRVHGVL